MWLNRNSKEQRQYETGQYETGQNIGIAICMRSSAPHVENLQSLLHAISVSTLLHLHPNYVISLLKLTPPSEAPVPLSFYVFLAKAVIGVCWVLAQLEWTDRIAHSCVSQEHLFNTSLFRDSHKFGQNTIPEQLGSLRP